MNQERAENAELLQELELEGYEVLEPATTGAVFQSRLLARYAVLRDPAGDDVVVTMTGRKPTGIFPRHLTRV